MRLEIAGGGWRQTEATAPETIARDWRRLEPMDPLPGAGAVVVSKLFKPERSLLFTLLRQFLLLRERYAAGECLGSRSPEGFRKLVIYLRSPPW